MPVSRTLSTCARLLLMGHLQVSGCNPQSGLVFANKRTFYKQRDNNFYPPASYVLSYLLTQLPQSTVEVTLFSVIVYWVRPDPSPSPSPACTLPNTDGTGAAGATSSLSALASCCCCRRFLLIDYHGAADCASCPPAWSRSRG